MPKGTIQFERTTDETISVFGHHYDCVVVRAIAQSGRMWVVWIDKFSGFPARWTIADSKLKFTFNLLSISVNPELDENEFIFVPPTDYHRAVAFPCSIVHPVGTPKN
jgi:outer membrane lipoprotein-sorting protein